MSRSMKRLRYAAIFLAGVLIAWAGGMWKVSRQAAKNASAGMRLIWGRA